MSNHVYEVKYTRNTDASVITTAIPAESASQAKEKVKAQEAARGCINVKIISSVKR